MILISKGTGNASANSQTLYNMISTILKSGIVFITMPIFTRLLGSVQYGEYSIYVSWLSILGCFMGLNVKSSLGTGVLFFGKRYKDFRSSVLLEGTVACICTAIILILVFKPINGIVKYPIALYILLIAESIGQYVTEFINFAWVYEKKAKYNMIMASSIVILTSVFSIILICNWSWDRDYLFVGRVIGTAFPQMLIAAAVLFGVLKKYPAGYNEEYWKYGLHFGIPMVVHLFSQQILVQSDRIMMKNMDVNGSDIGIYSFFYTYVAILTTILGALNNSWCPFLYDELKAKSYVQLGKRIGYYVEIFTCLSLGFLLVSREVTYFFANSEYWGGIDIIPLFVIVAYTMFFYQFAVNYEIYNARTKYVAIGTSISALSNIILNYFLIKKIGMYGAGLATLLSYIILAILHTVLVKKWKYERYPLSYKNVWIGGFAVLIGCILFYVLANFILIRWFMAVLIGMYLIFSVYKRKTIF